MTIVEFLEARLAEDEAAAREAITPDRPGTHWEWESTADDDDPESPRWLRTVEEFPTTSGVGDLPGFPLGYDCKAEPSPAMDHIARHDPARILREIAAKRSVIGKYLWADRVREQMEEDDDDVKWEWIFKSEALVEVLRALSCIYSDHPDYQKEWAL